MSLVSLLASGSSARSTPAPSTRTPVSDGDVVNVPSEVKERWPHARAVRARGTCMNKAIPDGHWFLVDPDSRAYREHLRRG